MTGARGLIGRRVAEIAMGCAAQPVCLVRPGREGESGLPGEHIAADLLDPPDLVDIMQGTDFVVHLAARSGGAAFQSASHAQVFDENQRMTRLVLTAAAQAGVRRVFLASSAVVYRDQGPIPLTEDSPVLRADEDHVSGYAWSKITDELLARWVSQESGLNLVVGRFTNVYGPEGVALPKPTTVVHALVRRALETGTNKTLQVWGDGTPIRSFLHADDAASAVIHVLAHGQEATTYNIDAGQPVKIQELAEIVRDAAAPGLHLEFIRRLGGSAASRVLDSTRLRHLGFEPKYTLKAGIADLIAHSQGDFY